MWGIGLMLVAVLGGIQAAPQEEDVTPEYINCANLFYSKIDNRLKSDQSSMESNFKMMNSKMNQNQREIEALKDKIDALDGKLQNMPSGSGGSVDLTQLEATITTKLNDLTQNLDGQIRAVVDALLVTHVEAIRQHVRDAVGTCAEAVKLTELADEVRGVKLGVDSVHNETRAIEGEVTRRCDSTNTLQAVNNVMTKVEEVKSEVDDLESGVGLRLGAVMDALADIHNNTSPPGPPGPPPTVIPGEITPCDDSTFRGANSINVCQSAVRFNKCHQEAVSYHCCHTCTTEGKLPEMGPWRYINQTREVSTLDVIRFFAL